MNNPFSTDKNIQARHMVLFIIWGAQLMSLLLFIVLSVAVLDSNKADDNSILFWIFAGLGLMLVAASFAVKQKFVAQAVAEQSPARLQQGYIIAWALCETAGLFGLLTRVITASPYFYFLFIVAVLGLLLHIPRREHLAAASYKKQL